MLMTCINGYIGMAFFLLGFCPSLYDDHQGKLSKLVRTSSIFECQHEFEKLSNHVIGLSENFQKSSLISYLKPLLQRVVLVA